MRLTTDLFAYCAERLPRWNTISISGYHIREAGSTAVQELAFTLANGIAYAQAAVDAGLSPDEFGERLSFFFNAHNHFFQEVAKFRAARRLWAEIMRERFGATNPKAPGAALPRPDGRLDADGAAAREQHRARRDPGALGGLRAARSRSTRTRSTRRSRCRPSARRGSRCARSRSSPNEAGGTDTADPLGGSYFVESLTDELEARARELIERVDELGGAVAAVEQGFVQGEIDDAAFRYQQEVESGERVIVGVNRYEEAEAERDRAAPDRSRGRAAAARAHRPRAGRAERGEAAAARSPRCATRRRGTREPAPADARGAARALHDRRDLRRPARRVRHVRRAARRP